MQPGSRAIITAPPADFAGLVEFAARQIASRGLRKASRLTPVLSTIRATGAGHEITPLTRGNPDIAPDLYRGRFAFGATAIECSGRVIFDHDVADEHWTAQLQSFDWLAHLKAGNRELWRVLARALIADWIERARSKSHKPVAWRNDLLSRRLISWIRHNRFLLEGASEDFHHIYFNSLTRQVRRLARSLVSETSKLNRLNAAIALNYASIGLAGLEPLRPAAQQKLAQELDQQIYPDGGHISRSPGVLLDILLDLMPLRTSLEDARLEVPDALNAALERMLPMLRFFSHGDSGLAQFNGVAAARAGHVRAVLASDEVCGRPLTHALHSGYCRLARGSSVAIMNTGTPPAPGINPQAAADALAFEFSEGSNRIVVNCGRPLVYDPKWQGVPRLTAAHSTVCLDEECTGTVLDGGLSRKIFGTPVILGPSDVTVEMNQANEGTLADASHDGYERRFGIRHHRRLFLAGSGLDLRGEDRFTINLDHASELDSVPFAIRFHLHPSVKATLSQDRGSVMLVLPNKAGWRFSARGGQLKLEESVYLPGETGPRQTTQIVVHGIAGRPDRVNWAFKRMENRKAPAPQPQSNPELPL